jgi:prophage antirepressor-like protein
MEEQENKSLTEYVFGKRKVRVVEIDGNPWFSAPDVCRVLGYTNSRRAIEPLEDDEKICLSKSLYESFTVTNGYSKTERRGAQTINFVNESGVYNLIFRSSLSEAKAFKWWVFHEVLPAIRKRGYYALEKQIAELKNELEECEEKITNLRR